MKLHDLVFFRRRSTSRRAATAEEEQELRKGRWLRVDESGHRPSSSKYRVSSYRKKLGAKRKLTNARLRGEIGESR
jgi:hypothetical protein